MTFTLNLCTVSATELESAITDQSPAVTGPSLTTRKVVFLVIAAAAPMAAMVGNVPLALVYGNGAGLPAAFLIATLVLICFSVGYASMSRKVINTTHGGRSSAGLFF